MAASLVGKVGVATALALPAVWSTGMLESAPVAAGALAGLPFLLVAVLLYALPATVARARGHHNAAAIGVLNLLLGWTLLGWVAALVWSLTSPAPSAAR